MTGDQLQIRMLTEQVELLQAQIAHSDRKAVDAVNDMATRTHNMMKTINEQHKADLSQLLEEKFDEFIIALSDLALVEETLHAVVNLLLVGSELTEEQNNEIAETLTTFLKRNA
jgi:gentisate 1,2-dioxygenase